MSAQGNLFAQASNNSLWYAYLNFDWYPAGASVTPGPIPLEATLSVNLRPDLHPPDLSIKRERENNKGEGPKPKSAHFVPINPKKVWEVWRSDNPLISLGFARPDPKKGLEKVSEVWGKMAPSIGCPWFFGFL